MKTLNKAFISKKLLEEGEIAHVEQLYDGDYVVKTDNQGYFLAIGKELNGYIGDTIRLVYVAREKGISDFILMSDRHGMICKLREGKPWQYWVGKE